MHSSRRGYPGLATFIVISASLGIAFATGCASPGPPRAPSLNLPQPVSDLTADRVGNMVELHFTVPHLSTDKTPLFDSKHHRSTLRGILCREVDHHDCVTIASLQPTLSSAAHTSSTYLDELPATLTNGSPKLLAYRVEFFSESGRSAGRSQPAYTASGPAPNPVSGLQAQGTRHGALLEWATAPNIFGEVLLKRVALAPKATLQAKPTPSKSPGHSSGIATKHTDRDDESWLATNSAEGRTLDSTVVAGELYRYTAVRRSMVTLGTNNFDIRSTPSTPVEFKLSETYPPDAPTALTAVGFQPPAAPGATELAHFAVDLIWQPVDNSIAAQLAAPIAGYNIYREPIDKQGQPLAKRTRLNNSPVQTPGYHDTTADASSRYRYAVTTIDGKGNESTPTTITLEPSPQ